MDEEKKAMYVYYLFILLGAVALVGLAALVFFQGAGAQPADEMVVDENSANFANQTNGTYGSLAECLSAKGAVLYGASWCPHCRNQKALFGETADKLTYVECQAPQGGQTEECAKTGITAYPTWIIGGRQYVGERSLEELAQLSGCAI